MKKIIQLFNYSFIIITIYFSNSCETIDDLQFDNLGLRSQIDSLMTRVTSLTEEIIEQKNLTKTLTDDLTEQVSQNKDIISQTSESLSELISDVDNVEQDLGTIDEYVGDMIRTTGDLTGELNNLLTQVSDLNAVIDQVNNSITNIQGNIHAHEDTDNDGVNNNLDNDDDDDGTPDTQDAFPEDPGETQDSDGDGLGDNEDTDDDNDNIPDTMDNEDNNVDPDPDPNICNDCPQKIPGKDIFVAGFSETEGAIYWVNGQKNIVDANAEATGITVSGGKIYISGYTYGSSAHYWVIDGQNIQKNNLPGFNAETNDIAVHNGKIYVGGIYSDQSQSRSYTCHWENGVKYDNSAPGSSNSYAMLVKSNGQVISVGSYITGHHRDTPAYWVNNTRNSLSVGNQADSYVMDVAIRPSDGKTIFAGDYTNENVMWIKPAYWVPGRNLGNIGSYDDANVYGLTVGQGGAVYMAGTIGKMEIQGWNGNYPNYTIHQKPAYWINNSPRILQGATVNGVQLTDGRATDIEIVDGKIVVLGFLNGMYYDTNNDGVPDDWDSDGIPDKNLDTGYPCIWIDGTPHVLDSQNVGEVHTLFIR